MRKNPIVFVYFILSALLLFSAYKLYLTSKQVTVSREEQPVKSEDTLIVISNPSPLRLLPYEIRLADEIFFLNQIFQGMVRLNNQLAPVPDLADFWEISADRLTYTFYLDSTRTFHNGQPVTAQDVLASFKYYFRNAGESYNLPYFKVIDGLEEFLAGTADTIRGIRVLGDRKIQIHLKQPFAPFLTLLALPEVKILPATVLEQLKQGKNPRLIGSGPYRVAVQSDTALILEAAHWNPNNLEPPYIKTVFFPLGEKQRQYADSLNFDINMYYYYVGDWVDEVFFVVNQPSLGVYLLGFNCKQFPSSAVDFRKAIAFGINRQELVDSAYGTARLQKHFTPFYYPHEGIIREVPNYNLDSARFYLKRFMANHHLDTLPTVTLAGDTTIHSQVMFKLIQKNLEALGIPVQIKKYYFPDSKREIQFLKGDVHLFLWGWSQDLPDPFFYFDVFLRSNQQMNLWQFKNSEVDSLLDRAERSMHARERNRCYTLIENKLSEYMPFFPLFNLRETVYFKKYIKGIELSPMGVSNLNLSHIWMDSKMRRGLYASYSETL